MGAEVTPRHFFSLRIGYRYQLTNPDYGRRWSNFSDRIGSGISTMSFDYAFIPLGDLGTTHRVSINFRFKPKDDCRLSPSRKCQYGICSEILTSVKSLFNSLICARETRCSMRVKNRSYTSC